MKSPNYGQIVRAITVAGTLLLAACSSTPPAAEPAVMKQPAAAAPADGRKWHYLDPATINPDDVIPPPLKTPEATANETALIDRLRAAASPEARAWARDAGAETPCDLLLVLDPAISHPGGGKVTLEDFKNAYPRTSDLLIKAGADAYGVTTAAKKKYERLRPAISGSTNADTYPSGHASRAAFQARLLIAIVPSADRDLVREAWFRALCRVTLGVHYPTDVTAGFIMGEYCAQRMLENGNDQFKKDLKAAQDEWAVKHH